MLAYRAAAIADSTLERAYAMPSTRRSTNCRTWISRRWRTPWRSPEPSARLRLATRSSSMTTATCSRPNHPTSSPFAHTTSSTTDAGCSTSSSPAPRASTSRSPSRPVSTKPDAVLAAAEAAGTKIAVAHQNRYRPGTRRVAQLVQAGEIGTLRYMHGVGKCDQRGGTHDLRVLGTHVLDALRFIAGDVAWATGHMQIEGRDVEVDDVFDGPEGLGQMAGDALTGYFAFTSGAIARFDTYTREPGPTPWFGYELWGDAGGISVRDGGRSILRYPAPVHQPGDPSLTWEPVEVPATTYPDGSPASAAQLLDALNRHAAADVIHLHRKRRRTGLQRPPGHRGARNGHGNPRRPPHPVPASPSPCRPAPIRWLSGRPKASRRGGWRAALDSPHSSGLGYSVTLLPDSADAYAACTTRSTFRPSSAVIGGSTSPRQPRSVRSTQVVVSAPATVVLEAPVVGSRHRR